MMMEGAGEDTSELEMEAMRLMMSQSMESGKKARSTRLHRNISSHSYVATRKERKQVLEDLEVNAPGVQTEEEGSEDSDHDEDCAFQNPVTRKWDECNPADTNSAPTLSVSHV